VNRAGFARHICFYTIGLKCRGQEEARSRLGKIPGAVVRSTGLKYIESPYELLHGNRMMSRKFLGITLRRWLEYLVAILLGNAIYYFSLLPYLPEALRHRGFREDWGTLVDFLVCAAVYGLIRLGSML
jgi:hypothetical protein